MSTAPKLTANLAPELEDQPRKSVPGPVPLVAIVGPTASGKSSLGEWLARKFGGEVLACDSTQVYRGFDIGTAKPTREERDDVPHHLLDLVDPGFAFTAGEYRCRAIAVLEDLRQRSRLPILTVRGWKRARTNTASSTCIEFCGVLTPRPLCALGPAIAPR